MTPVSPAKAQTTNRFAPLFVCAFVAACGPSSPPAPPVRAIPIPANSSKTTPEDALGYGSSFKTVVSTRFDFSLPLPDGASFEVDDKTDRWFVATHKPTASKLLVRMWREYAIVGRMQCEEQARLYRTLPEREKAVLIDIRRVDVPPGFDTIVDIHARQLTPARRFEGSVLAFGAWAHQCFAFVFVTQDDDETIVAARLSTIVHGSLEHMKFDDDLVLKRTPPDLKTPLRLDPSGSPFR